MKNLIIALATTCIALPAFAEDKKLEISGTDQMQYSTKALEVTAGEKVVLTLKHTGKLPKAAMGHNVVILKPDTKVPDFATKAMKAAATDYVPEDEDSKKVIVAHTKLIGGGETDSVTFTAPAEAGAYPFVCTFPGHFALMQGVLTVKAK